MTTVAAELEPGASVAGARRHLAGEFRRRGLETPELDARLLVGHALALDHAASPRNAHRRLTADETQAPLRRWRRAGWRANRSRASSAARNSGACRFGSTPTRLVPRPETETVVEAALAALEREAGRAASCGSPISAPARARCCSRCCPSCRQPSASAPMSAPPRSPAPATMRRRSAWRPRGVRRLRLRRRARRAVRPRRLQPALCGTQRHRGAGARGARLRSAPRARRRARWARWLPRDRRRRPAAACAGRHAGAGAWRRPGRGRDRAHGAAGLASRPPPRHDLAGVARALVLRPRHETFTFQMRKKALGLWGKND